MFYQATTSNVKMEHAEPIANLNGSNTASSTNLNNNSNNVDPLDFPMGDQDILDEFLDQRVYEATDGSPMKLESHSHNNLHNLGEALVNGAAGVSAHDPFDMKLDSGANYNLDNLDIGSFYQPSPDYLEESNNHSSFHSPEGVSPHNHNGQSHQQPAQSQQQSQSQQSQSQQHSMSHTALSSLHHNNNNNNNNSFQSSSHQHLEMPTATTFDSFPQSTASAYSTPPDKSPLSAYDFARSELAKLKFGNPNMIPQPSDVNVPDPATYLDFSPDAMSALPYKLELSSLPTYSRVETQIKLKFSLSPPPPSFLLHIPQDLISKNKFCLKDSVHDLPEELKKNVLFLDTYVLTSDLKKSCTICPRCIKREQKRASRRKSGLYGDQQDSNQPSSQQVSNGAAEDMGGSSPKGNNSWSDENMSKKAIIYNCKEIVSFPPPNGLNNDLSKSLELSVRIVCYCRHHKESKGFKLFFVVKNYLGEIVAKSITSPIMIMDRKKTTGTSRVEHSLPNSTANSSTNLVAAAASAANTVASTSTPVATGSSVSANANTAESGGLGSLHALSPNSFDGESNSEPTNTDTDRGVKRKKLSVDDSNNALSNPMFNGSSNNFSPISNSDTNTNTSTHNYFLKPSSSANLLHNPLSQFTQHSHQQLQIQQQQLQQQQAQLGGPQVPSIQRIIPAQGPIRGGIEVTLLGFNFRPGLLVKFGSNQALATHCWSETTIVTYLPPASQPGQVLLSFENESLMVGSVQQQQVFTYTDDTDRQLIELALQIVGLKMNGKLEDAKNIAKRIVGTDDKNGNGGGASSSTNEGSATSGATSAQNDVSSSEWFDNAHKAVEILTKSDLSTEDILISFLSLVDLPNCPIVLLNWQLCNGQGQTLLHLATLKNYSNLIRFLITHGCKIDVKDNQGLTPLFFASMCGYRQLISLFLECKSNYNLKLSNDKHLIDYCDSNVLDIFNDISDNDVDFAKNLMSNHATSGVLSKSISLDSLNSMFTMNYGRHISKMVIEESNEKKYIDSGDRQLARFDFKQSDNAGSSDVYDESNDSDEFADSEFESNDDDDDYEEYDYEDYAASGHRRRSGRHSRRQESSTDNSNINENADSSSPIGNDSLWQKVKNVFNNDEDIELPSYDDLFPFGTNNHHENQSSSKIIEVQREGMSGSQTSNSKGSSADQSQVQHNDEDCGVASDSSDDIMISYQLKTGRKTVKNDKMLLFFWFPALIVIAALFFSMSVMGYKFEFIEGWKVYVRSIIGNLMVGNERVLRVFQDETSGLKELLT